MATDHRLDKIAELLDIMDQLRGPGGCPWDARQTPETLKPYLIEEAYELLEAIDNGEPTAICEELGDLLLQIVFHTAIFNERGDFTIGDVAEGITAKMRRRHPHVFAETTFTDENELNRQWEAIKSQEKGAAREKPTILAGIPTSLPPTQRALKVIERTTRAGINWPQATLCGKIAADRLTTLTATSCPPSRHEELFGDLLFTLQLLAKQLQIDPDRALHRTLSSFSQHLTTIEQDCTTTEERQLRLSHFDVTNIL